MAVVEIKYTCLPIGNYKCRFKGIEVVEHEEYGAGWKWCFEVAAGEEQGLMCYRTTKPIATPGNSCGKFLAALKGQTPSDGLKVDPDEFKGKSYVCMVQAASAGSGSTRVESFVPGEDEIPF